MFDDPESILKTKIHNLEVRNRQLLESLHKQAFFNAGDLKIGESKTVFVGSITLRVTRGLGRFLAEEIP